MKWKTPTQKPRPHLGQFRLRLRFAFLPRQCEDGYTRWLTRVIVFEEYRRFKTATPAGAAYVQRWVPYKYN